MADDLRFSAEPPKPPSQDAATPQMPPAGVWPPIAPGPNIGNAYELADEPVDAQIVEPDLVAADAAQASAAPPDLIPGAAQPWTIDTRGHATRQPVRDKPRRRTWLLVVVLAIGVPVGGVALLGLLGWLFVASAKELPVAEKDRNAVLKAEDVVEFFPVLEVHPAAATIKKVRYLDGSHDVEYEYESHRGGDLELYVTCTVTVERNPSDAIASYATLGAFTQLGMSIAGNVKVVPRDDLFRWGDASSHALIENEFGTVGNLFRARSGKYIFDVTIIGVYFDDAETLAELLKPRLERMKSYQP